jgi:DNA polymerase epsilon subunit 4
MFIQYMAEQGHNVVKSEKKPRRNIQYRDLAQAVALHDSLQFLEDIVPRTVPYSQVKGNIQKRAKGPPGSLVEAGQMTLDGKVPAVNGSGANGDTEDAGDEESGPADPSAQLEMEIRGMRTSTGSVEAANGTVEKHEDRSGVTQDVEMMEL